MAKRKPVMEGQLEWLQDLELRLTLVQQQLAMLHVTRPELGDACKELGELVHEVRNKRTVAQNWKEVSEQNGFTKDA